MRYKVHLRLFQDDATGEWGVTHDDTCDDNYGNAFNAFWGGIGIFHDVFEHRHEHEHKYFRGDYSMNLIGEVAATGHIMHFASMYRPAFGYMPIQLAGINDTFGSIQESAEYGYTRYGHELMCKVPYQRVKTSYIMDEFLGEYEYKLSKLLKESTRLPTDEQERESAIQFRKSIKWWKIRNAALWGYRRAERLFPWNHHNTEMIEEFIDYWNKFCKDNDAESVARLYDKIIFTVVTGEEAKWTAHFRSNEDHSLTNYKHVEIW